MIGTLAVPLLFILLILIGLIRRVDVYDAFAEGAAKGLPVLLRILPYLAAMLVAVQLLRDSGVFDFLARLLAPVTVRAGLPGELVPLVLIRPFSGSASMAMLRETFSRFGADSYEGYLASILMGSSETIFYEVALYFGAVGVKKTRFTVPVSLIAMLVATLVSLLLARLLYAPAA